MDDSFSRALAHLKDFSGFRSANVLSPADLDGRGADLRLFEAVLTSGGDERIAIDPNTGRNRYGIPPGRAPDEVWFSSSTAAAISTRGYEAALLAFQHLMSTADAPLIAEWFDRIRNRLLALFGVPGAGVVLAASGTEAELIARVVAGNLLSRPLTSVVVAPGETGSGVPLAAAGRHFLGTAPFAAEVPCGQLLRGLEASDVEIDPVAIRDQAGVYLPVEDIDAAVAARAEANLSRGRDVLIHVLDCSKTNRSGPARAAVADLMQRFGDQILVVVDSCQLRCSPEQVRADLDAGFMVMLTGSKFAGGPPFAGALLLPPGIVDRLRLLSLPMGIFAYSAAGDWPAILRGAVQGGFAAPANIGLGLRWEAALAELEAVFSLEAGLRHRIVVRFGDVVRQLTTSCASFALIDHHAGALAHPTIFPVVSLAPAGTPVAAEAVYRALRSPLQSDTSDVGGRVYHVGQPVAVGRRQALRVCLSAPHMIDVGARLRRGGDFEEAFAPLAADLNALFLKWLTITSRSDHAPGALLRA